MGLSNDMIKIQEKNKQKLKMLLCKKTGKSILQIRV